MTPFAARAALDRRAAVAVLAGAQVGDLPLLWLIREALDAYDHACKADEPCEAIENCPRARPLVASGGHDLWLDPHQGILKEVDANGSLVRFHDAPNAALVLHDAVKDDPVKAERLLVAIESATKESLR